MISRFSITRRLLLLILIPLVAMGGFMITEALSRRSEARAAEALSANMQFGVVATDLIHEVQRERGLSSGLVANRDATTPAEIIAQRAAVDLAHERFLETLGELNDQSAAAFDEAVAGLNAFDTHRSAIDLGRVTLGQTGGQYTVAIDSILNALGSLDFSVDDGTLTSQVVALRSLSQSKEWLALERGYANAIISRGLFNAPWELPRYIALREVASESLTEFQVNASPALLASYSATLEGPSSVTQPLRDRLLVAERGEPLNLGIDEWWSAMTDHVDAMRSVETTASAEIIDAADSIVDDANGAVRNFILLALLLTLIVGLLALWLARSIVSPLRRLTSDVERTASQDLPDTIAAITAGEDVDVAPAESAFEGPEEFVRLTDSMNVLRSTATELAGEQAQIRRNVSDLFVNLGRRNQTLLNRQLAFIDELEQSEQNETTLASLYRLDHLSTRIRRNAESLLVLAGDESPRLWTEPMPIADVVRAAVAATEHFNRIRVDIRDEARISGRVVSDMTHLIAELAENATHFSPPSSAVRISGRAIGDGYALAVVDEGIGLGPEELERLNTLLGQPAEDFGLDGSGRLGLQIVARLAARHDIQVDLLPNGVDGVAARMVLPAAILAEPDAPDDSRPTQVGSLSARNQQTAARQPAPAAQHQQTAAREPAPAAQHQPAHQTAPAEPSHHQSELVINFGASTQIASVVQEIGTEKRVENSYDRRRRLLDPLKNRTSGEPEAYDQLPRRVRKSASPAEENATLPAGPQPDRTPEQVQSLLAGLTAGKARAETNGI